MGGLCVDVGHACLNKEKVHVAEVVCVSACIPHLWGGGGGVGGARQAVVGTTELRGKRALENVQACIGGLCKPLRGSARSTW